MRRRPSLSGPVAVLAAAGFLALGAGLRAAPAAGSVAAHVTMDNQVDFHPKSVTVHVGQAVEWSNGGLMIHSVTADPSLAVHDTDVHLPVGAKPFDSGNLRRGDTYRHTFQVPGRYRYFCVPHEADGMVGTVVVER